MAELAPEGTAPGAGEPWWVRTELPTWVLAAAIYACWFALVWFHASLPWWVLLPAGAYVTAWHFNYQHEAVHGWRSIPRWLRTAIVWPPLGLWFPFEIYRRNHTIHHRNARLTYPGQDTETLYHAGDAWANYSGPWRLLLMANQTVAGRLLLGPFIRWWKLLRNDIAPLFAGRRDDLWIWIRHVIGISVILYFVTGVAGMPLWQYLLFFFYGGMALGMLRPFVEHRWAEKPYGRIASVESNWVFGLMFLWNNLHIAHHLHPTIPWFQLPRFYRENRERLLALNGNYVFSGYGVIAARHLFKPVFVPRHPEA